MTPSRGSKGLTRLRAGIALVLVTLLAAAVSHALVPAAERIAKAMANANEASSRDQALQLELTLRVADREPIGTGKLITHPSGLARLELRDASGRVERHLRVVTDHTASRGGRELEEPRAFLPPLSFLQADSSDVLLQALSDYGLDPNAAALAPCGGSICYVLGDPKRVAPAPAESDLAKEVGLPAGSSGASTAAKVPATAGEAADPVIPGLWVDSRSFEIVRMQGLDGAVVDFGPVVDFSGVRFPGSITIYEPEREPIRFDIQSIVPVNAPAAGFRRAWLLTPPESGEEGALPPTAPAAR